MSSPREISPEESTERTGESPPELDDMQRKDLGQVALLSLVIFVAAALLGHGATAEPHDLAADASASTDTSHSRTDLAPTSSDGSGSGDEGAFFSLYQVSGVVAADAWLGVAHRLAAEAAACAETRLPKARRAFHAEDYEEAIRVLQAELECVDSGERMHRARFLLAEVQQRTEAHEDVLATLDPLKDLELPVDDFVTMLRARSLHALKQWDEALDALDRVLEDERGPRYHEARVLHARVAFDAGRFEQAEKELSSVIDAYPEHPRLERLILERGLARKELGKKDAAARDFDHVVFDWPWKDAATTARNELANLVAAGVERPSHSYDSRYERARRLRINKHWDIADAAYRELLDEVETKDGVSSEENRLWFQIALNFYSASRYDDALPVLERLRELHDEDRGSGTSRNYVHTMIVRCLVYGGDFEAGLEALKRRNARYSKHTQKRSLAGFYEDNGHFERALRYYDQILSSSRKHTWHYAFLLYKAGKYKDATARFKYLVRRSSGTTRAKYEYWLGRSYMKRGRFDTARDIFEELSNDWSRHYYGLQAQNRLLEIDHYQREVKPLVAAAEATTHGAAGGSRMGTPVVEPDVDDDGVTFDSTGDVVASGSETDDGVGADSNVVARAVAPALRGFADSVDPDADPDQGPRDVAATVAPSGQIAFADIPSVEDRDEVPTGRAHIHWSALPFGATTFASNDEKAAADAEGRRGDFMPAYTEGPPVEGALREAAEKWGHLFPRLHRAEFLHSVGLETDARWEVRDIALEYRSLRGRSAPRGDRPKHLGYRWGKHYIDNRRSGRRGYWGLDLDERWFPTPDDKEAREALVERQRGIIENASEMHELLIRAMKEAGDYHIVRRFGRSSRYYRTDPMTGDRRDEWMEVYPRAFPRLVQKHARENGIDPYLMWALMTVESSFNPDSISYADARGLLQVIPKTGIKVATTLGVDAYGPHDLLDERMSIRFGTWYFAQLVKKFHGQELFAIAGYNGGPHNVARWMTQRADDMEMDAFVETIPFDQARRYVKKVLKYAGLYQRLYERNPVVYVGNRIEPVFRTHPNY